MLDQQQADRNNVITGIMVHYCRFLQYARKGKYIKLASVLNNAKDVYSVFGIILEYLEVSSTNGVTFINLPPVDVHLVTCNNCTTLKAGCIDTTNVISFVISNK